MTNWYAKAQALLPEMMENRRAFHRWPELGNCETETSAKIEKLLVSYGIETYRPVGTAVVGVLRGAGPGKCAALRSDMDALPLEEKTGLVFASENPGVMHACGHDMHMAALLGAARLLAEEREKLSGCVKFFFQPDEEGNGGARRMIEAGCMEKPRVTAVFGAHVSPELKAGHIGIRYGKFYAASNPFDIVFHGKSCHGAQPWDGNDALAAAARAVLLLRELPAELESRAVVSTGVLNSGIAGNIIANRAEMRGIIRTLGPDDREKAKNLLRDRVDRVCAEFGVTADVNIIESYPGVVNSDGMTALAHAAARNAFPEGCIDIISEPSMTTEDFGCFIEAASGCFYHVGVGGDRPLHNPEFAPDEKALAPAAAMHAACVWAYLNQK